MGEGEGSGCEGEDEDCGWLHGVLKCCLVLRVGGRGDEWTMSVVDPCCRR